MKPSADDDETNSCCAIPSPRAEEGGGRVVPFDNIMPVDWWCWCDDEDGEKEEEEEEEEGEEEEEEEDDVDDFDVAVVAISAAVRAGFVDGPGPGPDPGNFLEIVCSSSEVDGLDGRLRRSRDDVSSESTANERKSAHLLLTHKVHLYSTKRVR